MSSLRRGHANLLGIVPILTDDPRRESEEDEKCSVIVLIISVRVRVVQQAQDKQP